MRFQSYHPAITLLFFVAVISCTLTWTHPILLAISLIGSGSYAISLKHSNGLRWLIGCLLFAVLWGAWFATYNHFGITPLAELPNGNYLTLEAILSGLDEGFRLAATVLWLYSAVVVFTADKIIYLLGRAWPKLALLAAVAFRAAPMTASHANNISLAQSGIGRGPKQASNFAKQAHNMIGRLSTLITWSTDRALVMSDSMRSRGSLLSHRSAYSLYRFDIRDRSMLLVLVGLIAICIAGSYLGVTCIELNPIIEIPTAPALFVFTSVGYFVLCMLPLALDMKEAASHKH